MKDKDSDKKITFEIDAEFGDHIVDEWNNQFIALRKVSWNGRAPKLELRKYVTTETGEHCGKGCTFLTDRGPAELTYTLIDTGYGDTDKIISKVAKRPDFADVMVKYIGDTLTDEQIEKLKTPIEDDVDGEEGYYDPREELFDEAM